MKPFLPALIVCVSLLTTPATAQVELFFQAQQLSGLTDKQKAKVIDAHGVEVVTCLAYYQIAKEATQRKDSTDPSITEMDKTISKLNARAYLLQDERKVQARHKVAMADMLEAMQGNIDRFSNALAEYAPICREVGDTQRTGARLTHLRQKLYPGQ